MFLKKRHHADIMARLHSNNNNSNTDNSKQMEVIEDSDDSGFGSDLVIDEDYDENLDIAAKPEKMDLDDPEMKEEWFVKKEKERVSVIKHTCDLSRGIDGEKEKEEEKVINSGCCSKKEEENFSNDGCCSKMNSVIGIKKNKSV